MIRTDGERERESQGTLCYQHDLKMDHIYIYIYKLNALRFIYIYIYIYINLRAFSVDVED